MGASLYPEQLDAVERLSSGRILCAEVGSGKSRTALAFYYLKICRGKLRINSVGTDGDMKTPKDLYVITTAKKRDSMDWEEECIPFRISTDPLYSVSGVKLTVDSWNNIGKYASVCNAFFIFDEQRLVGKGAWVKAFLQIAKKNEWILLSGTPGDQWMDYIPVFIANGFYRNRTEFIQRHIVYARYTKFPKIDRVVDANRLKNLRKMILVDMKIQKPTTVHDQEIICDYSKDLERMIFRHWDPFEQKPIENVSQLCNLMRKVVNTDASRIEAVKKLVKENPRSIIFYNFDYELELLRKMAKDIGITKAELNGHMHQDVPTCSEWVYLVQYAAGCEAWNCTTTNVLIFYSQSYSYKQTIQAAGRIDRVNTPYKDLYYYHIRSNSKIDLAIRRCFLRKEEFNDRKIFSKRRSF